MTAPVVFTDLDDTLFQTARKCPDKKVDGLRLMSTLVDGSPSGYATRRQENLLNWFRAGKVIPVTARSTEVMARVDIEQAPAICSNGGCITLEGGVIDDEWHSHLQASAAKEPSIFEIYAAMTGPLDEGQFRHWIVSEYGLPLYIVIKSNVDDGEILEQLRDSHASLTPAGWRRHKNGNNLAYMPSWLNKRHAVTYLINKIRTTAPQTPIIGVGDSTSDVGFMDLCDFAMAPTNSQLWQAVRNDNDWTR
ncbi:sucrose-6-phosphate hydrolase [Sphingomonas sp. IC081]|uniref:sucrose-6-phosphate hydrolase n=1 Tax=Sphingomonas sp. IC081 TaxID=304378 RepID=UPI0011597653|nr:sucrose-6-phosphate hydrolase [Sphingomonas sp. IC081]QDK35787.1 sucrose-6-phosphate hydrolase [Sphingomonas sp. IC081]